MEIRKEKKLERVLQARVSIAGNKVNLGPLLDKVKKSSGHSKISKSLNWKDVAASMGLPPHCGPDVKSAHLKHLKAFESGQVFGATFDATKGNVDPNAKALIHSHVKEALAHLRKLALDPGNAGHSEGDNGKFQETIKGFLGRLQSNHLKSNRPRRPSKYELRSRTPHTPRPKLQPQTPLEHKSVPVGERFQAVVPSTVAVNADNDDENSKLFLGEVVWSKTVARSHSASMCFCADDGSEDCVKLHVNEQRGKLKQELGEDVFREWGFHTMGESLIKLAKWSMREQAEFSAIVRRCQGGNEKKLWPDLQASFAGRRNREELGSYYFNVYVLRKRAHQNRTYAPDSEKFDTDKEDDDLLVT